MGRSYKLVESIQSNLTEKINKDNAEINKAIANPNLGKNKDKIKAAGYDLEQGSDGKVYAVRNSKTGKWVDPSSYSKEKRSKVDLKGELDSTRKRTHTTARRKDDTAENRIPKSLKVGKDKFGNDLYNREDTESYSPNYMDDAKKSTSDNINNYKKAIKTRDEEKRYADRGRGSLGYYEKKVADAQKDLDWHKDYIANADKKSADAEAQRKAIIDKIRAKRKTESEEFLKESEDFEDKLKAIYNHYRQDGMEDAFWSDLMNCVDNLEYLNQWYDSLNESEKLEESTVYNTKSREEYDNVEDFNSAINDDASTVSNVLEDLKSKMNTDESVEILEAHKSSINSDFLDKIYK